MPKRRKFIKTDYNMLVLREDDQILHIDGDVMAQLYWDLADEKLAYVVRCKDCKWYGREDDTGTLCPVIEAGGYPKEDGYCYLAEREKDDNG